MKRSSFITWDQLKVGAIIVVALLILGIAVYKVGKTNNMFGSRFQLVAFVSNASGLVPGGSVLVAGQLAGTVKDIQFLPVDYDTTRNLRLVLSIDKDLEPQIRRDSKANIRTLGLLGDKVVDITVGTPRYTALADGDTIPINPSLDYDQVLAQASGAVGDMVALTHDMRTITGGIVRGEGTVGQLVTNRQLYDQLNGTLARANSMLAQLQNPNGTVGRMLQDPTLYNRLIDVIASTDSLVMSVNRKNGTVGRLLSDTTLYVNLVGITQGADSLMRTLTNGQGTASRLLTDQTLYDQLNKLVHDLSAVLGDVQKDPGRYMKGAIQVKVF